ncbi:hypothetical protein L6V77_26670 [Myxococcota bacterium]|nr:hypothetical protein [Myxococcota bacterium]
MKALVPPIRKVKVTLEDLLPQGDHLRHVAYESLAGDETTRPDGRHSGRRPNRPDMDGLSKREVYGLALDNDLAWFEKVASAVRANPFTWSPSLRTWVPKDPNRPENGTRPIDDPSEIKRLVAIYVRALLLGKLHHRFTPGQFGSRPGTACTRARATAQDHVATAIHRAIRGGYTWAVLIDLTDAFGRVPEGLTLRELGRMGLEPDAAQFVWSMCRINAVVQRRQVTPFARLGMGIEQGNCLSASIMDLVLAPVLRRTEARLDVIVVSYLDDIYMLARSRSDAEDAYRLFRDIAEGLGFDNVRDLWDGTGFQGKKSTIVDSTVTPVRVLKTYDICPLGVSLAPEKVADFLDDLRERGIPSGQVSLPTLRRLTRCQALSGQATRSRNSQLLRSPQRLPGSRPAPSGVCSRFAPPSEGEYTSTGIVTPQPLPDEDAPLSSQDQGVVEPAEDAQDLSTDGDSFSGDVVLSRRADGHREPHSDLPVSAVFGGICSLGVGLLPSSNPLRGELDFVCSSRVASAGSISHPKGDSTRSEGPTQPCGGRRGNDGNPPAPHFLRFQDPAVQAALVAGRGFRFGVTFKGAVLDLTGLDALGVHPGRLPLVVNGLIKAVKTGGTAQVLIDPWEAWTLLPKILGRQGDTVYRRVETLNLPDGKLMITLVATAPRARPSVPAQPPPCGADALLGCRAINAATGFHELRVVESGVRRVRRLTVSAPSALGGVVAAVAAWTASRANSTAVALPTTGRLAAVAELLVERKYLRLSTAFHPKTSGRSA